MLLAVKAMLVLAHGITTHQTSNITHPHTKQTVGSNLLNQSAVERTPPAVSTQPATTNSRSKAQTSQPGCCVVGQSNKEKSKLQMTTAHPHAQETGYLFCAGCGQAMTAATKVTCWNNCHVRQTMLCEVTTPWCGILTAAVSSGFDSTCRETSICCANASTVLQDSQGWQSIPQVAARVAVLLCLPA